LFCYSTTQRGWHSSRLSILVLTIFQHTLQVKYLLFGWNRAENKFKTVLHAWQVTSQGWISATVSHSREQLMTVWWNSVGECRKRKSEEKRNVATGHSLLPKCLLSAPKMRWREHYATLAIANTVVRTWNRKHVIEIITELAADFWKCRNMFKRFFQCHHMSSQTSWSPTRLWLKCNRLLRLGRPVGAVTLSRWEWWWNDRWIWGARGGLKPSFYQLPTPWSPWASSPFKEKRTW